METGPGLVEDEARRRGIVARLRERYDEAREFVVSELPLEDQAHGHLEWILGKQSNAEHDESPLDTEVSEIVVLWLQDLARELDDQASVPATPGSGLGAAATADVRHAAADGLRTATRDFAEAFLSSELAPVSGP